MRLSLVTTLGLFLLASSRAAAADFPTGTFTMKEKNGIEWAVTFDAKGKYTVTRDGKLAAEGKFKATKEELEITDTGGPEATAKVGTYKWKLDGKKLTFTKIKDDAGGRASTVTAGAWEKKD